MSDKPKMYNVTRCWSNGSKIDEVDISGTMEFIMRSQMAKHVAHMIVTSEDELYVVVWDKVGVPYAHPVHEYVDVHIPNIAAKFTERSIEWKTLLDLVLIDKARREHTYA